MGGPPVSRSLRGEAVRGRYLRVAIPEYGLPPTEIFVPEQITVEDLVPIVGDDDRVIAEAIAEFPDLAKRFYIPQMYARAVMGRESAIVYTVIEFDGVRVDLSTGWSLSVEEGQKADIVDDVQAERMNEIKPYLAGELFNIKQAVLAIRGEMSDESNPDRLMYLVRYYANEDVVKLILGLVDQQLPDDAPSELQAMRRLIESLQLTEAEVDFLKELQEYYTRMDQLREQEQQVFNEGWGTEEAEAKRAKLEWKKREELKHITQKFLALLGPS